MASVSESKSIGAGESRHQLVVLTLFSGSCFPTPAAGSNANLTVRAELSDVTLVSDPVPLKSNTPVFDEQQLVWEVTKTQLRQFRSRKVLLRVELWLEKELIGHLVLDLRTAQPIMSPEEQPDIRTCKVIGTPLTLDLALSLEEADNINADITDDDDITEIETVSHSDITDPFSPTLIEDCIDGEGGYFLIGPKASATENYALSLCLVYAKHLQLSVNGNTVYHDPYFWQYNLLGVDIQSDQFSNLNSSDDSFVSEKATASIKSNKEILREYLARASISVKLCSGAVVIAAADLSLSCLLDHAGNINVEDVTTELDLVSGHNLSVGQDAHGNKPSLGLRIKLFPVNSDNEVTTGRLSDSELEVDESNVNKNVPESQITPTKLSRDSKPDISSVATNPKKLKTSSHPAVIAQEFSTAENPAQHDATEYLTLPKTEAPVVSKPENEQDSPLKSQYLTPASSLPVSSNVTPVKSPEIKHSKAETKTFANRSEVAKHYKLSVDLSNVLMISKDYDNQDGILAYKYLALHRDPIRTDNFKILSGQSLSVSKGFCLFTFYVDEDKMISTFSQHILSVALYVSEKLVGLAKVNLSNVIKTGSWKDRVNLLERHSQDLIGFIDVELTLKDDKDKENSADVEIKQHQDTLIATKDLLNQAAKELETWKLDQKKRFNDNLLQIEQQHLNLLGQEWKEREIERQNTVQEKLTVMKGLEDELRKELEKLEVERKEMEELKRSLLLERDQIDLEKKNIKHEKGAVVDRLKQQLREKDSKLSAKDSEIELLSKKCKLLENESKRPPRLKSASMEKSKLDENLLTELNQLRAEKLSWQSSLEHTHKELAWYKNNSETLKQEIVTLHDQREKMYSQQIAGLEKQVREMINKEKTGLSPIVSESATSGKSLTDAEVQANIHVNMSVLNQDEENEMEEMRQFTRDGLARLEENRDMLARTGIYTDKDPIVVKINEQIQKLRRKLEAEKDK